MRNATLVMALATCLVAACGDDDVNPGSDGGNNPQFDAAPGQPDSAAATGTYHHYVTNKFYVPQSGAEAEEYGLNIDGDSQGVVDNHLGTVLGGLQSNLGFNSQDQMDLATEDGYIILLHSLYADDLMTDATARWQVFLGERKDNPDYSGAGTFTVDSTGPSDARMDGTIVGGNFTGGPGEFEFALSMVPDADPVRIPLIAARLDMDVTASSCAGKVGGAITKENVDDVLVPAIAEMVNFQIQIDCTNPAAGTCTAGSSGAQLLDMFDSDNAADLGTVTSQELLDNVLIATLLAPDVDLLDADGNYVPLADRDGEEDSLSLGIKIDCVSATFTAPGE